MLSVRVLALGMLFIAMRGGFGTHFRGGIMSFKPVGNKQVRHSDNDKLFRVDCHLLYHPT